MQDKDTYVTIMLVTLRNRNKYNAHYFSFCERISVKA